MLTGNIRYRANWRGKVIMQVEECQHRPTLNGPYIDLIDVTIWRDARVEDLTALGKAEK